MFADWDSKSKETDRPLSEADRKELGGLRKEVALLRKGGFKGPGQPKTLAAAVAGKRTDPGTKAAAGQQQWIRASSRE